MSKHAIMIFRIVAGLWLTAWYCNAPGVPGFWHNLTEALGFDIVYDVFPAILSSAKVALAIYLLPLACTASLVWTNSSVARAASALMVGCSLALLLHLETGNDATFLTAFWSALWLLWFSLNAHRADADFFATARGLIHGVIGVVFLGALVGKLTPEYRSGEAFFRIYFRDNPSFPYPELRGGMTPAAFRELAGWFSKSSLWAETMLALAPVLPTRVVVPLGGLAMLTMMSAWTFHLFSVLGSLVGLLIAAEIMRRRERELEPAEADYVV